MTSKTDSLVAEEVQVDPSDIRVQHNLVGDAWNWVSWPAIRSSSPSKFSILVDSKVISEIARRPGSRWIGDVVVACRSFVSTDATCTLPQACVVEVVADLQRALDSNSPRTFEMPRCLTANRHGRGWFTIEDPAGMLVDAAAMDALLVMPVRLLLPRQNSL